MVDHLHPCTVYTAHLNVIQALVCGTHLAIFLPDIYRAYGAENEAKLAFHNILETCKAFMPNVLGNGESKQKQKDKAEDEDDKNNIEGKDEMIKEQDGSSAFVAPIFLVVFLFEYHNLVFGPSYEKLKMMERFLSFSLDTKKGSFWFVELENDIIWKRKLESGMNQTWHDDAPFVATWVATLWSSNIDSTSSHLTNSRFSIQYSPEREIRRHIAYLVEHRNQALQVQYNWRELTSPNISGIEKQDEEKNNTKKAAKRHRYRHNKKLKKMEEQKECRKDCVQNTRDSDLTSEQLNVIFAYGQIWPHINHPKVHYYHAETEAG